MARTEDHLEELLKLSPEKRERAARILLDSLDADADADEGAEGAQVAELVRRMRALDAGEVQLISASDARKRVMARLRVVRETTRDQ